MIRLQIGSDERTDDSISEDWVNQQVRRRRSEGAPVCARVSIAAGDMTFSLSTAGCRSGGGSLSSFSPKEREIIALWSKCGLDDPEFHGGQLIAFLKQLRRYL